MKSRAVGMLLMFVLAWYGVYRLVTWPIRAVIGRWPGRRERLLQARVAQLRQAMADVRQLVDVLGAGDPELQTTLDKLLRKCEKQIELTLSQQGSAEDLDNENPWAGAIRLLKKAKRVRELDRNADVAKQGHILARIDDGSDSYSIAECTPEEFARIETLASTGYAVRRLEAGDSAAVNKHKAKHVPGRHVPGPNVPEPVLGRVGHVGGIESISIDQHRYFFGFNYRDDRVLSPLMEDKQLMAEFAAAYMAQTDQVPHDVDYWMELVEDAVASSSLCDDESRTLTTAQLHAFGDGLALMQSRNVANPGLRVEEHILYLLNASLDDAGDAFLSSAPELERLGLRSGDCEDELLLEELDQLLEMARGETPLPAGASFVDVAVVIRGYWERTIRRVPANWALLFGKFVAKS